MEKTRRIRRKAKIRKKLRGNGGCPRLTVFRSLTSFYVQAIDDDLCVTLCSGKVRKKNKEGAKELADIMIEKLKKKGIDRVRFDRNGYRYHGSIKVLADGIREGSIQF